MVSEMQRILVATPAVHNNPVLSWSLLDLPAEIRLLILNLLLVSDTEIFIYCRRRQKTEVDKGSIESQILRTCERIYEEGCEILYSKNIFRTLNTSLQAFSEGFLCDIGSANRFLIKMLFIEDDHYSVVDGAQLLLEEPAPAITKLFQGHLQLCNLEVLGVGFIWRNRYRESGPRLDDRLVKYYLGLTKQEYVAPCSDLENTARAFDALVRGRVLCAAASLQGIPQMRFVCEAKLRSSPSRWILFSRVRYRFPAHEDGQDEEWLVSPVATVCDHHWKTNCH
jgi:hypothetical protein